MNRTALILLFYTLLVIVWGAWVRISHSGDGCGESWPLCEGEFIPAAGDQKTWTEYFHRLTSGIYGLIVIGIFLWAWSRRSIFSPAVVRASFLVLVLTIVEALLGAKLVIFGLVGQNDSFFRVAIMAFHQLNSFLLMGAVFLLYRSSLDRVKKLNDPPWREVLFQKKSSLLLLALLLIAMTGSWASLSNTLYPSDGLLDGLMKDFSQDSHPLIRLRVLHPILATLLCSVLIFSSWVNYQIRNQKESLGILAVFLGALIFGWMTLILQAPLWMKISHLVFAHGVWLYSLNLLFSWSQSNESKTVSAR